MPIQCSELAVASEGCKHIFLLLQYHVKVEALVLLHAGQVRALDARRVSVRAYGLQAGQRLREGGVDGRPTGAERSCEA